MLKYNSSPPAQRGFTLVELMVTVAILAILATIATASYTNQIRKSRRTDARSAILDMAGREEKLFSTTNAYSIDPVALGYGAVAFPLPIGSLYYNINVTVADPANPTTYTITATAINQQASDLACTSLTLTNTGQQSNGGSGSVADCWGN